MIDSESPDGTGPTNSTVGVNIKRLRNDRGWSLALFGEHLKSAGVSVSRMSLSRLENGTRRVDVDELMAIAHIFGVTPLALLLPRTDEGDQPVRFTGDVYRYADPEKGEDIPDEERYTAEEVWLAALGRGSLRSVRSTDPATVRTARLTILLASFPRWLDPDSFPEWPEHGSPGSL